MEEKNSTPHQGRQAQAKRYARLRRRLGLLQLALFAAYLALWISLRLAPRLSTLMVESAGRAGMPWWLELAAIALALALLWQLMALPLEFYRGFVLPQRFGLSTQSVAGWLSDLIKSSLLIALIGGPLLLGLYALLRAAPTTWWLWAGLAYSLLSALLATLAPLLILPLFYKQRPLAEQYAPLRERLLDLAQRAGTYVEGVYSFDMSRRTRAANAALVGMGRTRRILLGDTLLENFSPDEIEVVLAHELAHHVHRDIPLFITVQSGINLLLLFLVSRALAFLSPLLGVPRPADPASLPLLLGLAAAFALLGMPLGNAFSRWRERLADAFALRMTANPQAFVSAMVRLADQNLADADPERWVVLLLASHPPIRERIQAARAFPAQGPDG
jgi:STE24 endopeptidase